jgi:hypothetical protein
VSPRVPYLNVTIRKLLRRCRYWGSSDDFPPALVRDVVLAPRCPNDVKAILQVSERESE